VSLANLVTQQQKLKLPSQKQRSSNNILHLTSWQLLLQLLVLMYKSSVTN